MTGVGAGVSMSRIGGILMPFICYGAIEWWGVFGPYWVFFFTTVIAFYVTKQLPFDTTGLVLDGYVEEKDIKDHESTKSKVNKEDNT